MGASRKLVVLGIAVALLVLWPDGAGAAPVDTASDHAAVVAFHSYAEDLVSNLPAVHAAVADYVSSISARCPDVLAPLASLPPGSVNQSAAVAVVGELGEDLGVAAYPAVRARFAKLARTLARLRWSSPQTGHTIRGFLTAQRRLYALSPSHLCADLQAFVGSAGQTTPTGTQRWLARAARLLSVQTSRFAAFGDVMGQFLSPSDAGLVADTNRAFKRDGAGLKAILTPQATRLVTALGSSS